MSDQRAGGMRAGYIGEDRARRLAVEERVRVELAAIRQERAEQFDMLRSFEHVKEFLDAK